MQCAPRPILKRSSSTPSAEKHVVFPPSPALTRTFAAHSPAAYDRSPIVVGPNICALPERGGRTYLLEDQLSSPSRRRSCSKSGRVPHPRAIRDTPSMIPSMPSLIPDLSSESDESDGFPSPHLENQEFFFGLKTPEDTPNPLSFLPYAPSNPYQSISSKDEATHVESPQRRRERRNDSSCDNNRIRNEAEEASALSSPRRKSRSRSSQQPTSTFALCDSFSSFALRDDGCLGGF
ncbi:hypothetical protein AN958_10684 [Leucoagaricus sp. SymC.cos]|nr:hypothetical protein AN958_10684 [Leucoagaricus sp. SymC.cos]